MKKITKYMVTSALTAALMAPVAMANTKDDETRSVSSFDKVAILGSLDMKVNVGGKQKVVVHGPADLISHIETEVEDGTLSVHYEEDFEWNRKWRNAKVWVEVTAPSLSAATIKGSGDLDIEDGKGDSFAVVVRGSGDLTANNMRYKDFKTETKGSGDITVRGTCDNIMASIHGSGDLNAEDMKCKNASASVQGSGDITVYASNMAQARVRGSGDIRVNGNPKKVDAKESGSGSIDY